MDFSGYPESGLYYGGSERKVSVNASGIEYMLKFRKRDEFGMRNNHISEYVGSHIFNLLGIEAQETFLGHYQGEEVVACRSFVGKNEQFVPFNDVGESTLEHDKEAYQYEYAEVIGSLKFPECNRALAAVMERIDFDAIDDVIEGTIFATDVHKDFLRHMVRARYERILLPPYEQLREGLQ